MTECAAKNDWTPAEKWAWEQIAGGNIADFSARLGILDPRLPKGWGAKRRLSNSFLYSILFERPWSENIPLAGVRIVGALCKGPLTFDRVRAKHPLRLESCRFEKAVDLSGLQTEYGLSLTGSAFRGDLTAPGLAVATVLDLTGAEIAGALDLTGAKIGHLLLAGSSCQAIALSNAKIERDVDFRGATVQGVASLDRARIGQTLTMAGNLGVPTVFAQEVNLSSAIIGASLSLNGATVEGRLSMNDLNVGQHLFLHGLEGAPSRFKEIDLTGAQIEGQVECHSDVVTGALIMSSMRVGRHLLMRGSETATPTFTGEVNLGNAQIGGFLEVGAATFEMAVTMAGVRVGANLTGVGLASKPTRFQGDLNLAVAQVAGKLEFSRTVFQGDVWLTAAEVKGSLSLFGTTFEKQLSMRDLRVGRHLFLWSLDDCDSTFAGDVDASYVAVGGHLELAGLTFESAFTMSAARIGEDFTVYAKSPKQTLFKATTNLAATRVDGTMTLANARFEGALDMRALRVGRHLFIRKAEGLEPIVFDAEVILAHAEIEGHVELDYSTFQALSLESIRVGQNLRAVEASFALPVNATSARVGGSLNIAGAHFNGLDLSASETTGQLRLGGSDIKASWGGEYQLDLRDAKAGSLQDWAAPKGKRGDWPSSWPARGHVQLDGFIYDRLGGYGVSREAQMIDRSTTWFVHWLELDEPYSPQPYEHLAATFRQAGEALKANRILYKSRERDRIASWSWRKPFEQLRGLPRWIGLGLLRVTIGYGIGYRFFIALLWALLFTAVGMAVLGMGPVGAAKGVQLVTWLDKAAYSFDQLLPIIELNHGFGEVKLTPPVEHYFYLHRVMGFLLGSFIAAGVAGLTQRSRA